MGDDYRLTSWDVHLPTVILLTALLRVASSFLKSPKQLCQDVRGPVKDAPSLCWFKTPPAMTLEGARPRDRGQKSSKVPGGSNPWLKVFVSSPEIPLRAKGKIWKD